MDSYLKMNFNRNREASKLVLVNNAGWLGEVKPTGKINPDSFKRAYDINLLAPSVLSKMFVDQTQETGQERMVINISSGAGAYPVPSWSSYCASKAGLNAFSEVLMQELRNHNIRVSCVSPGSVDTGFSGTTTNGDTSWKLKPDDVAQAVVDLLDHEQRSLPSMVELRPSKPRR